MNATDAKRPAVAVCEPGEVAGWIGLADATLLGPEPIALPPEVAERLRLYGPRAEMPLYVAAGVLRVGKQAAWRYTQRDPASGAVVLGHRKGTGGKVLVTGADLAAFIAATCSPPVPTTGARSRSDDSRARQAAADARRRHAL